MSKYIYLAQEHKNITSEKKKKMAPPKPYPRKNQDSRNTQPRPRLPQVR